MMPRHAGGTTTAKRADVAERRRQAIELRRAGATWQQIADTLGYAGKAAAAKDVARALEYITREPSEQLVAEEVSRLDAMLTGLWPNARKGHLGAVDRVLKIMERRARYLGLDKVADVRGEVEVGDGRVVVRFASPALDTTAAPPVVDLPAATPTDGA